MSADSLDSDPAEASRISDSNEAHKHPELLLGPNPLIEALPRFVPHTEWSKLLSRYPLQGKDWRSYKPEYREALLNFAPLHFAAVRTAFEPATGLQRLLRRSCVLRNPILAVERRRANLVGLSESLRDMLQVSSLDAAGSIISGMTATGKSSLVVRVLEIIAPDQLILHGPSKTYGWSRLEQVVWLYVDHPSNGTRGGLLKRILVAIDNVLSTDYSKQYAKTANLDALLALVARLLSNHRVALLVIDEKQQRSFEDSPWNVEFVLFYLSLMNLGISVVLVGNPLSFVNIQNFSQVMRRFSVGGVHALEPAASQNTAWWKSDFVPRMRKFSLIEHCEIPEEERSKAEFQHCGGLAGIYPYLNSALQSVALRRGGNQATIRSGDIEAAAKSPAFVEVKNIALALASSQQGLAASYSDIPSEKAAFSNSAASAKESESNTPLSIPTEGAVTTVKRLLARFNQEHSRRTGTFLKQLETIRKLSPEELRLLGVNEDLLKQADAIAGGRPKKQGKAAADE